MIYIGTDEGMTILCDLCGRKERSTAAEQNLVSTYEHGAGVFLKRGWQLKPDICPECVKRANRRRHAGQGVFMTETFIATLTVTEAGQPGQDVFYECAARECEDGRLEIIRPADDAKLASYAAGVWSIRIDDGRAVVPADNDGEDDAES